MQVNTEVYGDRSTWRRDTSGFSPNQNVPDDMQFKRGEYDTIENYCSNNRLEAGKAIDYSICYAGQAEGMPLASMRTWNMNNSTLVATTYKRNVSTGWFFGHSTNGNFMTKLYCSYDIFADRESNNVRDYYWTPNGNIVAYPKQPSARVIPIVSFPTRGCYFGIRCTIFNPSSVSTQNKWLHELRSGDWSSWKIISAWGELYSYNTSDQNYTAVTSSASDHCCVCSNTEFEFKADSGDALPVLSYALFAYNSRIPVFGWIDNEYSVKRVNGVYHAMQRVFNTSTVTSSYAPVFIDTVPDAVFNVVNYTDWGLGFEGYCDITSDNLEAIRKAAAAYGLFFTEKDPSTYYNNANRWIDTDMFCGLLDSQGIGHGDYTRGTGNIDNPVYSMGSSQNSPYSPGGGGGTDPNTYSNTTDFKTVVGVFSGTKQYVMSGLSVKNLSDSLYTIIGNWTGVTYAEIMGKVASDFLVSNPMDTIVSLHAYPFTPTKSATSTHIVLGKYETNISAYELTGQIETINFTGKKIFPRFGDCYLDYEPYTRYEVYVPFCGTVKLNASDILGHTLNVRLKVDMFTGVCTGYILADDLCIETVTGTCGVQLPMSGLDTATINANIVSANINYKSALSSEINAVMSPVTFTGIGSALSNPVAMGDRVNQAQLSVQQASYDLHHIETPPHTIGSASPLTGWCMDTTARILIYYPTGDAITQEQPPSLIDTPEYGHTTGYTCMMQGSVSDFTGFTVGNIDTSSIAGATAEERDQIKSAFASGVWL